MVAANDVSPGVLALAMKVLQPRTCWWKLTMQKARSPRGTFAMRAMSVACCGPDCFCRTLMWSVSSRNFMAIDRQAGLSAWRIARP